MTPALQIIGIIIVVLGWTFTAGLVGAVLVWYWATERHKPALAKFCDTLGPVLVTIVLVLLFMAHIVLTIVLMRS